MRRRLAAFAAGAAHVLVVEVPGEWVLRAAVERAVLERGWRLATAPADADLLAVCGRPGPDLSALLDRMWDQLPGPRARLDVPDHEALASSVEGGYQELADAAGQRRDAEERPSSPTVGDMDHADMDHGDMDHGDVDHGDMDHGDMDHGDMDHGDMDHGDMDHGDMEMAPGGIPLAEGGPDRDGLEMDVLHLSLGPGLPHWPAGLVVRCSLQGDVVVGAEARLLDGGHGARASSSSPPWASGHLLAARRVDLTVDVLALLGWPAAASAARQSRDLLLAAVDPSDVARAQARLARLRRRVRRSLVLRSSLRGIGTVTPEDLERHGLPEALLGDVRDRLLSALDLVARADDGGASAEATPAALSAPSALSARSALSALSALPDLLTGLDLAAARLVVASLGLEPSLARREAAHG